MSNYKFKIGEVVTYIGNTNKWTFSKDIETSHKGVIEKVTNTDEGNVYSVKFDSELIASIDEKDLE